MPVWQIGLLRTRAQDPEDAVEDLPAAAPGSSAPVRASRHLTNEGFECLPLFVRQIHRRRILLLDAVYHPFMRSLVVCCPFKLSQPLEHRADHNSVTRRRVAGDDKMLWLSAIHYASILRIPAYLLVDRETHSA